MHTNVIGVRCANLLFSSDTPEPLAYLFQRFFSLAATLYLLLALFSANALAAGGEEVLLRKTYAGNIDYVATGASFRNSGTNACTFVSPMESTVSLNIPVGADILEAYLYFAGSADDGTYSGTTIDLSTQTGLTLNGVPISNTAGFNGRDFPNLTDLGSGVVDFFGARRDVSDIVTGPGAYTFAGMDVHLESQGRPTTGTCLAAWALVVIFEDPSVTDIRVINLFDGFKDFKNSTFDLQPRNFVVSASSPTGKMTHMSYEGDADLTGTENFQIQVGTGPFTQKTNAFNPTNNQYNSTVTGPDVFDVNNTWGFDLDTYDISTDLATQPNAYDATTRYNAGQDLVILMAEFFSVDNKPLADIEVSLGSLGLFESSTSNTAQYVISVENNGDGTDNLATGFATGYIHVYDDLPAGISIDSLSDITAPGWDCSGTNLGLNQVRCTYDLSTLSGGQLDRNTALPDIYVTVDVATPSSPVINTAYATLCGVDPDTCWQFAEKHTDSDQFDPKNYFEDFEDLFDITSKSSTNNNVDREITPIISGSPSNLSTSTKSVTDINGGSTVANDILEYVITLTESGGVTATGVEISDPISTKVTSFNYQGTTCGGSPSQSYTFGVLTVTGLTVNANSSCTVTYRVTIKSTAVAGNTIDNVASISSNNGIGGNATAPTVLVAGTGAGSKILYLDDLNLGTRELSRLPPSSNTSTTLNTNQTRTMVLNPVLAKDLDVDSGVIPVSVWVEALTNGNYSVRARLRYDTTGSNTLIGEATISNVGMTTGVGNAQLFPFQINVASPITGIDAGENLSLEIRNNNGNAGQIRIHSVLDNTDSNVALDALDVINVDDIRFYTDAGLTTELTGQIEAGETIYIVTEISDPFGDFDITGARLTLVDPNLANQLTNVPMTEIADQNGADSAAKWYMYTYVIPAATSIDPGIWVAQVTGLEGTEGTVTHTDADSFETIAPAISVDYTVDVITANAGDTLTYTVTINNTGGSATSLDINQPVPVGTQNLTITNAAGGSTVGSTSSQIVISGINAAPGTTTVTFTVDVQGSAQPGDLIDHTISVDNMGTAESAIAPSVLISPYGTPAGNKPLYADNLGSAPRLDRTVPTSDTTRSIASQGASQILTLSPVLQSSLTLDAGDITGAIWVSRGSTSFAGQRTIQATLGYTGAASGTIGSDSVTIQLASGISGAQYIPFTINLASPLVIPANTSLTLRITNNTTVAGESIVIHSFKDGIHPSRMALNANSPLTVAVDYLDNSLDSGGTPITVANPGSSIWVRATVTDPFGSNDITAADVTITDPNAAVQVTAQSMSVPTTQPANGSQKYFEYNYTLTSTLGDWTAQVTAVEGTEGLVTATNSADINVNNLSENLEDSYKVVANITTMDLGNTNEGDTLQYTIELIETGGLDATGVDVSDVIPANTTFVSGSLTIDGTPQADPGGGTINLTGLTVPAGSSMTIQFSVTINTPSTPGTIISNTADITHPAASPSTFQLSAEDVVVSGVATTGSKVIYLEDLNTTPKLTRTQPQTAGTTDLITIANGSASTITLNPALAAPITIDPADGDIPVSLRVNTTAGFSFGNVTVTLSYQLGGSTVAIGSLTQFAFLGGGLATNTYNLPVNALMTIPAGATLQLNINNAMSSPMRVYSHDSAGNYSNFSFDPDPVINVDEISFWTAPNGAGTVVSNPNPDNVNVDVYARIVISDPFGDYDIQAPDAAINPTTVVITDPDAAVTNEGTNTSCSAPCYAYVGEDTANDPPGDDTRTFYYLIRIQSDPPSTRGTWTVQVTANEGLEVGQVSNVKANGFTTLSQPNLSTSAKTYTNTGDVDPGDTLTYVVTLNNSGGQDADNVIFSDTLQSSPVTLTFSSASTTCTDETLTPLANPSHSGGVVTLNNISVPGGGSCTITVNALVGAGNPGDQINNTANITNPKGPGKTAMAPTILLSESQIPVAGNKQLYLESLGSSDNLTRTQPTSTSSRQLNSLGGSITIDLAASTTRAMTLQAGNISVNLSISNDGNGGFFGQNRLTNVEVLVDANDGNGFVSIDSSELNLTLSTTPSMQSFIVTNGSDLTLNPGSVFRLVIENNTTDTPRAITIHQNSSAPFSELVVPLVNSIEVTELKFYDNSFGNGGTEVTPATVQSGDTVFVRATIADGFGSFDVNTGCTGGTPTNCPTLVLTDPTASSDAPIDMVYIDAPDSSSRRFEIEVYPAGMGLDGTWQVDVEASEGVEGLIFDTATATFERVGIPVLTVTKSSSGSYDPNTIVVFSELITNSGTGPAHNLIVNNKLGDFMTLELVDDGGDWTAIDTLSAGYSVVSKEFDNGNGLYDYDPTVTGPCTLPIASPCYDLNIEEFRVELDNPLPVGDSITITYKARLE